MKVHSNRPEMEFHSITIGTGIFKEVMGEILTCWGVEYSVSIIMGKVERRQVTFVDVTEEFINFADNVVEKHNIDYQDLSREDLIKMIKSK